MFKLVLVIGFIAGIVWAAWLILKVILKGRPKQPEQKKTSKPKNK